MTMRSAGEPGGCVLRSDHVALTTTDRRLHDNRTAGALCPELEAIAAAHDRLHTQASRDPSAIDQAARRVAEAEREGEQRARLELSGDVLRQVTRAAKRKCEADSEYEHAISRASRLGLSHREIAAAAQVSHGTVRAILIRASAITDNGQPAEERPSDAEPGELAA